MAKVLYLIDSLEVGGAEQSLAAIAAHFSDTEVLACHIYSGDTLRSVYEAAGVPVVSLNVSGRYAIGTAIRRVVRLVDQWKPAVIHTCLFRAGLIGRIVGKTVGVPVIDSFVSDSYGPERTSKMSPLRAMKHSIVRLTDTLTARWVTQFTANSNAVADSNAHELRVPRNRITVIYRGRDPSPFAPGRCAPAVLLDPNGAVIRGPIFLNVGRLIEGKGQADLLRAFVTVRNRRPDAHLVIAGEGRFRDVLEMLRSELGLTACVHLLGRRTDIAALLSSADVFVLPSHYEGHSGALLEAMFAGKPIVASSILPNRESVEHNQTALLVPVQDTEGLAEAMLKMLDRPEDAARFGTRAREEALRRFDIRRIAEQHEELYRRVIEEHHR